MGTGQTESSRWTKTALLRKILCLLWGLSHLKIRSLSLAKDDCLSTKGKARLPRQRQILTTWYDWSIHNIKICQLPKGSLETKKRHKPIFHPFLLEPIRVRARHLGIFWTSPSFYAMQLKSWGTQDTLSEDRPGTGIPPLLVFLVRVLLHWLLVATEYLLYVKDCTPGVSTSRGAEFHNSTQGKKENILKQQQTGW